MNSDNVLKLRILRRRSHDDPGHWQDILFAVSDEGMTVASALTVINDSVGTENAFKDCDGNPVSAIVWENSCLQKKCGACAMVINGRPCLACDTKLLPFVGKTDALTVEPLRKFPVVADLMVDRSRMRENLKNLELWQNGDNTVGDRENEDSYQASLCIQCGCCLDVCPNFEFDGEFFGAAAFVPAAREMINSSPEDRRELRRNYSRHIYSGCGKSLSCKDICPRGIDTEKLLVRSNAVLLWGKRKSGRL